MQSLRLSYLKKFFIFLTIIILFVTVKLLDSVGETKPKQTTEPWVEREESYQTQTPVRTFLKIFHLDLKGGPPKLNYLLKILPLVKESGANAILIEYEDMFPFFGKLKNLSAINAYSKNEIKIFVQFAHSLKMEVIPLIQTFGHLEYALKLEEFVSLRESEAFPSEICPSNKEAVDLVKEMIKQIMKAHPNSNYIHMGCDEVRNIGVCPKCARINSKTLFANHVIKISNYIKSQYPKVVPLIWDDMLRHWTFNKLDNSGLGTAVEPVVWAYGNNIYNLVPPLTFKIYKRIFPTIWIASSFKGAFGETQSLPNLTLHLENHLSWMEIITQKSNQVTDKSEIAGIFLTGWSRYDHFAVLCELLPVGIPSLTLSLTFLDPEIDNRTLGLKKWLKTLRCPRKYLFYRGKNESHYEPRMGNCSFPGNDLYSKMVEYQNLKARVMKMVGKTESGGWTSEYNFRKNFTNPWRLKNMFPEEGFAGEILKKNILKWKSSFLGLMEKYFDVHTKREWEDQNIKPLEKMLDEIWKKFNMSMRRTWPRRPIE